MLSMIEDGLEVTNGTVDARRGAGDPRHRPRDAVPSDRADAACGRDPRRPETGSSPGADHQGRPFRPGAQAGAIRARRPFSRRRGSSARRPRPPTTACSGATATGRSARSWWAHSLKSDILPALEAGSYGVHVPHEHAWALDHADEPAESFRNDSAGSITSANCGGFLAAALIGDESTCPDGRRGAPLGLFCEGRGGLERPYRQPFPLISCSFHICAYGCLCSTKPRFSTPPASPTGRWCSQTKSISSTTWKARRARARCSSPSTPSPRR